MAILGSTGLTISQLGLGISRLPVDNGIKKNNTTTSQLGKWDIMYTAYKLGCTHFDTADGYEFGNSERLVGKFVNYQKQQGVNANIVITTKVGWNFYNIFVDEEIKGFVERETRMDLDRYPEGAVLPFDLGQNFSYEYLKFAIERSIERLHVDSLDLLLLHVPPLEVLASGMWNTNLKRLQKARLIKIYGVSVRSPIEVFSALNNGTPAVIQIPLTVAVSTPMKEALRYARSRGVGIIGREVFAQGLLLKHLVSLSPLHDIDSTRIARALIEMTLDLDLVDSLIVGCTSVSQVRNVFTELKEPLAVLEKELIARESRLFFEALPDTEVRVSTDLTNDVLRYKNRQNTKR